MMLNTNRFLLILLVGLVAAPLTQAQLKTFKPGEVIKSSEINENFEYLEEQIGSAGDAASAQCSANQDGSNVVISCTDGSSAVLAGSGKVVFYPEGTTGSVPLVDYSNGDISVVDASDTVLALAAPEIFDNANGYAIYLTINNKNITAVIYNNQKSARVELVSYNWGYDYQASTAFFKSEDCSGPVFIYPSRNSPQYGLVNTGTRFYVAGENAESESLLFNSRIISAHIDYNGLYRVATGCQTGEFVFPAYLASEYTPPTEIINAVYPVSLKQLP